MNRTVWLFIGLLVGAGGMWTYASQVREPEIVARTTQAVKEMVEADKVATSNEISGIIVKADDETGVFTVQTSVKGETKDIIVTTDLNTKFYRLVAESNDGREQIGSSLITEGASVIIIINPSGSETNQYATEIVLLS
jgi:protoporphyrinogen oxidase